MKTKIIFIGILLCVIGGCGIFNSNKFNPHSLDGLYSFVYHIDIPLPDSLCEYAGCFSQNWYTNYMYVNYPHFQACTALGKGSPYKPIGKEDVKVAQISGNKFKIKKINGNIVNNDGVFYIITKKSSHYKDGITYELIFTKIKNEKELYGIHFRNPSDYGGPTNKGYQKCLSEAPDTTSIFP